jgi:LPS-assembly protein
MMVRTGDRELRLRRALPGLAASKGRPLRVVRWPLLAYAFACFLALLTPWQQAFGQAQTGLEQIIKPPKIESSEPMLLQADQMIYDNDNGRITAKGNVELYYGNYTLLADSVVYDRNANTLTALGNVRIKDPDGAVITADHITLTDDFRDGFIDALRLVTKDDTRIVAQSASREAGNVTVFEKGWFTPCKICEDNPDKAPTWRIRAGKIIHRRDQATITYRNAVFDFWGVPVLYVPWFQTADPTVKRKSGFLMPVYSHSDELGTVVQVPYYFALSDHYDFTFAPMFTENAGTVLIGNWRQRLSSGGYSVELAGVWNNLDDPNSAADQDFRGSIRTEGKFALDPYWDWGWDILAESDETFRRFYNLDSRLKTDRVSQVYLEGLHDRNYMSTRFYNTQSLLFTDEPFSEATVYPIVDYDYIVNKPILGGELSFNSNAMAFSSQDGTDDQRAILEANWRRQMIDGIGQVYTPFAQLRGDVYNISGVDPNTVNGSEDFDTQDPHDGGIVRGNAVAGFEYRYPFVATTGPITHVVEPIGQIIARPSSIGNQQDIPNEDALSLVFDDTLLFDIDKFSGYDRVETGTRANVGFRYTGQLASGAYARAVFGQSYQIAGQNPYDTDFYKSAGLATDDSDFVGGLYLQASSYLGFSAQSRFDHETFDIRRTDLGSTAHYGPAQLGINYANVTAEPGLAAGQPRQEVVAAGVLALTTYWALTGNLRYDLETDQTITDGLGLQFQNDCLTAAVTYQRSFIQDQDIRPDERFVLSLSLKYLGSYSYSYGGTDAAGLFGPTGSDTNQ